MTVRSDRLRGAVLALLLPFALAACADPAPEPPLVAGQAAEPQPGSAAAAPSEAPVALDPMFDGLGKTGEHAALVAALRAGGMVNRLRGEGPFTLFAPRDAAFAALPEGELARLMEPENKPALVRLLNGHLVTGSLGGTLAEAVAAGGGRARFATAAGSILTVLPAGDGGFLVVDDSGAQARVVAADLPMTNGRVHSLDSVLQP